MFTFAVGLHVATIADGRQNCQRRDGMSHVHEKRTNPLSLQAICGFLPLHAISAKSTMTVNAMTMSRRRMLIVLCCLCIVSIVRADTDSFTQARAGYRYQFPRDHGSHDRFRTEWWYYTGNLAAKDGRSFGYQLTFFRRGIPPEEVETLPSKWSITQLYLAHFAVSDLGRGRFRYGERLSRAALGKAGSETGRLHVWIDRWRAEAMDRDTAARSDGRQILEASDGDLSIVLTVVPEKPLVIHGTGGISRKGAAPEQASHYYSFTNLATTGTITIGDESFEVTGSSWMDHEFGSADLSPDLVGWDWFSLQMADQTEVMLYRLRRADGSADPISSGTFVDREGRGHALSLSDFTLDAISFWTSPLSKARYPQKWRLAIPSRNLSLELVPRMADQELRTDRSTQVTYWEGAIEGRGTSGAKPLAGFGYMELTGYAEPFSKKL
jgi:predicted secreted hydrolase